MYKWLLLNFLLLLGASSCTDSSDNIEDLKAVGGAKYGGVFRFMSSEKVETLFPLEATSVYAQRVTSQIFDPILKLDPTGSRVIPCIAEKFTVTPDGKTYTLTIRKGVYFHPDACLDGDTRELTAEDVKFSLDMACSGLKINQISYLFKDKIVGAEEFFNQTSKEFKKGGVSGITVKGNQVIIKLKDAYTGFDKILTYTGLGIFPKEAYDFYKDDIRKHPVGTGAFMLGSMSDDGIKLVRNPNYWEKDEFGNKLPFLAEVHLSYTKDKRGELQAFRERKIDLVLEIPSEDVENILGSLQEAQEGKTVKHKVDSKPSFSVKYIGLSQAHPAFKDVRVRQAFYYAIDREELVNQEIQGDGYPVEHGYIPASPFYPAEKVKSPKFNPAKAQQLLAEAGYPKGKGFPNLTIYVSGNKDATSHLLAKGVAKQLKKNLDIDLNVELVSFDKRNELVISGEASIWISGWVADYPDSENFLSIFQGRYASSNSSFLNPFKYVNPKFDHLYDQVNKEMNEKKRTQLIIECDQMIVDDAVVIPILNDDFITMINSRIRNFKTNSLESLNFSDIFIKEPKGSE